MSDLQQFYEDERKKWDSISAKKLDPEEVHKLKIPDGDNFHKQVGRDSVAAGVNEFLGDVKGKQVLEVGCGSGKMSALLAASGAKVTAFDLSPISIDVARTRGMINELDSLMQLAVAAGERLPFANNSFDILFGRAILHHLDVSMGAEEIYRVLKPGGKAVFIEPMGMNPILNYVRDNIPYADKNPVGDDEPLNYRQIKQWGEPFDKFEYREVHLLGMVERAFGYKRRVRLPILHKTDNAIRKLLPFMRRFYRYIVLYMEK